MEKAVAIKSGTLKDLDGLSELFDAYRVFYRKESDRRLSRRFIADRLKNKDSIILVAVSRDEGYLGFVQLYPSFSSTAARRIMILNDLYVKEPARKRGIGEMLMDASLLLAKKRGCARVDLATEKSNKGAQSLYAKKKFQQNSGYLYYSFALPIA